MYLFAVSRRASFQPTPIRTPGAAPSSLKDGLEPMNVDRTHGQTNFPIICRHCNKPDHYARECPNIFDVWMMTTEEMLELIPELLALVDIYVGL